MTDAADLPENTRTDMSATADRRTFLKTAGLAGAAGALAGAAHGKFGLAPISPAQAQTPAQPAAPVKLSADKWWPSKWGADDEAGASNHITPAKVLDAAKWIRDGKVYRLGRVYEQGMPLFGQRAFVLRIPGAPTGGPFGDNKLVYNDEFLATEIGQTGTQFDGLGHIGIQLGRDGDKNEMRFYNGFTSAEIGKPYGLAKLGVEKLKPLFTRGHLFDLAGLKGGMMDAGQEITLADLRACLQRQNMQEADIKPGDAVLFNTGWGSLWMKNNDRYNSGEPGIGLEVARWVVEKDLCLTGADTWGVEVVPNPDKTLGFPVHGELICKRGIFIQENLVFDELVTDRKYQFAFVFAPAPIKGATGSNGSPIAVT
jgi:kynurenine formamidase